MPGVKQALCAVKYLDKRQGWLSFGRGTSGAKGDGEIRLTQSYEAEALSTCSVRTVVLHLAVTGERCHQFI